jgi:hypothetical protein
MYSYKSLTVVNINNLGEYKMKDIKQALKVWEALGEIPCDDNDELEIPVLIARTIIKKDELPILTPYPINSDKPYTKTTKNGYTRFEKGTDKYDLWHWIENTYNVSIGNDLMGGK